MGRPNDPYLGANGEEGTGFDGIHWDTLGKIAGDYGAEVEGTREFLRRAKESLAALGLSQTLNFVDLGRLHRREKIVR